MRENDPHELGQEMVGERGLRGTSTPTAPEAVASWLGSQDGIAFW